MGKNFKVQEIAIENIALASVLTVPSGKEQSKMNDYKAALISYRTAMAMAASMLL